MKGQVAVVISKTSNACIPSRGKVPPQKEKWSMTDSATKKPACNIKESRTRGEFYEN
jgi:hypothetical protein